MVVKRTEYLSVLTGGRLDNFRCSDNLSGWKVRCFTYIAKGFLRFGRKSSMIKLPSSTRKASRTPLACRSAEIF